MSSLFLRTDDLVLLKLESNLARKSEAEGLGGGIGSASAGPALAAAVLSGGGVSGLVARAAATAAEDKMSEASTLCRFSSLIGIMSSLREDSASDAYILLNRRMSSIYPACPSANHD